MARSTKNLNTDGHPDVALGGEVVHEPSLHWPWVTYPGHYGAFHTFAEAENGPWRFCLCARTALANAVYLARLDHDLWTTQPHLRGKYVGAPEANLPRRKFWEKPTDPAWFEPGICHRCNQATPSLRWAHPMYETQFNQYHGWYTEQARLRSGFAKYGGGFTPDADPELIDLMELCTKINGELGPAATSAERSRWRRRFQDQARADFGYRKVGDGAVSETQLAALVRELLGENAGDLVRHHRPAWLTGLELDIWLPRHRLGIEYQGQQHYEAVDHWGGEEALEALRERDRAKKQLCASNDVALLEVKFTEPLTREHVAKRLAEHLEGEVLAQPRRRRPAAQPAEESTPRAAQAPSRTPKVRVFIGSDPSSPDQSQMVGSIEGHGVPRVTAAGNLRELVRWAATKGATTYMVFEEGRGWNELTEQERDALL